LSKVRGGIHLPVTEDLLSLDPLTSHPYLNNAKLSYNLTDGHSIFDNVHDVLEEVMLKAVTAKVHRVWMIDAAGKLMSVVSLSDIIANFVEA
jgi:hypothetical protein